MNKILAKVGLALFLILGITLAILFFANGKNFLGIITLLICTLTTVIFTHPKAYPFRFMYPGLITFLFFMILPMFFTIFIGFTNLSTGHLLSQDRVHDILLKETYIPHENDQNYFFKLKKINEDTYQAFVTGPAKRETYTATFSTKQIVKEIFLSPVPIDLRENALKRGEVYQLRDELIKFAFILPNKNKLFYLRTNILVNIKKRFRPKGENKLQDNKTGAIFTPDDITGFYTDGKNTLAPGYYVNVGFKNFQKLYSNKSIRSSFFKIFIWTILWATGAVVLSFTLGMFLALVVNNKTLRLKSVYRSLLIIPYSIPFFISILIFKGMLNKDFGIINELITSVGLPKVSWLGDPLMAKISCLLVNLWLGFPYMFLITTGILQSIPGSVYEAASLDGAGRWATFKSITLPLIFSAVAPLLVGSFAFNLNNFVGIYLLTGGGPPIMGAVTPAGETDILISYTYRLAFEGGQGQDFGMASSIAMLIFIIITIITLINFKLSGMMKEAKQS